MAVRFRHVVDHIPERLIGNPCGKRLRGPKCRRLHQPHGPSGDGENQSQPHENAAFPKAHELPLNELERLAREYSIGPIANFTRRLQNILFVAMTNVSTRISSQMVSRRGPRQGFRWDPFPLSFQVPADLSSPPQKRGLSMQSSPTRGHQVSLEAQDWCCVLLRRQALA